MRALITGGAGFIGTHLARRLLREGWQVRVLDNLHPQIHGENAELAKDLRGEVEFTKGDVRDADLMRRMLDDCDAVAHLAAETGTGQSMYEVRRYEDMNIGGTAVLMDALVNAKPERLKTVVIASSRAIYGEGAYRCAQHGYLFPPLRDAEQMRAGKFEPQCGECGADCVMLATAEDAPLQATSFYGLTKQVQEQMTLMFGRQLGLRTVALRYQNVYGPGQSLKNPYTGILAIFSNLARENKTIDIFEDGCESRDFVYVQDAVEATWLALSGESTMVEAVNVGSGKATTVIEVARSIVEFFGSSSELRVTGNFRAGDIRHNVADMQKAARVLGFSPRWEWRRGLAEFLNWAQTEESGATGYEKSLKEMEEKGLFYSRR